MSNPFTDDQEARLRALIAEARGGRGEKDPDVALRMSCLQIAGRLGVRGDPREAADLFVEYVKTGVFADHAGSNAA